MNYPFEFKELLITDRVLDLLGFGEYWGGTAEFGYRRLNFGRPEHGEVRGYTVVEYDGCVLQVDWDKEEYFSSRWAGEDFTTDLYFLHELYEDIVSKRTKEEVEWFVAKCKSEYMHHALKSYLDWKELNDLKSK